MCFHLDMPEVIKFVFRINKIIFSPWQPLINKKNYVMLSLIISYKNNHNASYYRHTQYVIHNTEVKKVGVECSELT